MAGRPSGCAAVSDRRHEAGGGCSPRPAARPPRSKAALLAARRAPPARGQGQCVGLRPDSEHSPWGQWVPESPESRCTPAPSLWAGVRGHRARPGPCPAPTRRGPRTRGAWPGPSPPQPRGLPSATAPGSDDRRDTGRERGPGSTEASGDPGGLGHRGHCLPGRTYTGSGTGSGPLPLTLHSAKAHRGQQQLRPRPTLGRDLALHTAELRPPPSSTGAPDPSPSPGV